MANVDPLGADELGADESGLAELAAKREEALAAAKQAALDNDLGPARELAAIEAAEIKTADRAAEQAEAIRNATSGSQILDIVGKDDAPAAPDIPILKDWTGDPEPRAWLASEWLPAGRAALFTGAGGGGKSLLALQLAAGIASGNRNPLHSDPRGEADQGPMLDGKPGIAVFATWEDEPEEVLRRLAWAAVDRTALGDRLHVLNLAGLGPLWESDKDAVTGERTPVGDFVEDHVRDVRPRLVVIDPTAGAFAANENDRATVRAWLSHLGALAAQTGAAVILIAHPPKDAKHAFSGSTDWRGGVRSLWTLGPKSVRGWTGAPNRHGNPKDPAKGRALTLDKANYAKDGRRAWLRLHVVPGPNPGDPPALMRWEEVTARQSANAYHKWRGWDAPKRKDSADSQGEGAEHTNPAEAQFTKRTPYAPGELGP